MDGVEKPGSESVCTTLRDGVWPARFSSCGSSALLLGLMRSQCSPLGRQGARTYARDISTGTVVISWMFTATQHHARSARISRLSTRRVFVHAIRVEAKSRSRRTQRQRADCSIVAAFNIHTFHSKTAVHIVALSSSCAATPRSRRSEQHHHDSTYCNKPAATAKVRESQIRRATPQRC